MSVDDRESDERTVWIPGWRWKWSVFHCRISLFHHSLPSPPPCLTLHLRLRDGMTERGEVRAKRESAVPSLIPFTILALRARFATGMSDVRNDMTVRSEGEMNDVTRDELRQGLADPSLHSHIIHLPTRATLTTLASHG